MTEQPPLEHYLCLICHTQPRRGHSRCCGGCYARVRGDLAIVAWAYIHLDETMRALPPAMRGGTSRHGSSESAPPLRLDLVDVRVSIAENLTRWAAHIAQNHEPVIRGPVTQDLVTVIRWLLEQALSWVSDQPWVWEFAAHIAELRRMAYSVAPWERIRVDLPTPCPDCKLLTLSTYPGDNTAVCRNRACGRQVPIATMKETRRWTRTIAAA